MTALLVYIPLNQQNISVMMYFIATSG